MLSAKCWSQHVSMLNVLTFVNEDLTQSTTNTDGNIIIFAGILLNKILDKLKFGQDDGVR